MAFTLRQLQFFIAAAEQGSVSGAARALSISQSSVTDAIRALENDHGVVSSHLSDFLFVKILLPEASIGQAHMSDDLSEKQTHPFCVFFIAKLPNSPNLSPSPENRRLCYGRKVQTSGRIR